jgi:autotransporter-associated beta strand protein
VSNTIGTYVLKTDQNVTATGIIGTGTQALRKTGVAALILSRPSSGNGGMIFDEGSIELISTTGASLSGAISTTAGVLSTGGITVSGTGTAAAAIGGGSGDTANNTYVGTTTVASGNLIANKSAGIIAIPGDLVIQTGGTFRYAGNNTGNQIADTSVITIDGGAFGDVTAAGVSPTNPGAAETVADVILTANGGNFSTGRAVFTATGAFRVFGGNALAHRAGTITATEVEVGAAGSISLDGGSTTVGSQSRLTVGADGLTLTGGTINLNSHAGVVSAASVGSIVTLNGDVTSVGTSQILDIKTAVMTAATATIDLGGTERAFDVTNSLTIGADAAPIPLTNGGVIKDGSGTLTMTGSQTLTSLTINDGVVALGVAPPPSPAAAIDLALESAAGSPQAVPEPGSLGLLACGIVGWLIRRRRD